MLTKKRCICPLNIILKLSSFHLRIILNSQVVNYFSEKYNILSLNSNEQSLLYYWTYHTSKLKPNYVEKYSLIFQVLENKILSKKVSICLGGIIITIRFPFSNMRIHTLKLCNYNSFTNLP